MDYPLVSIGIPFYNPGKYIEYTLESVFKQSYRPIELILCNDASTDDSLEIVRKWIALKNAPNFQIHLHLLEKNAGVSVACQYMLERASGKYFQMLGADDLIIESKIASQVEYLEKNEEFALVYGNMRRIDEHGISYEEDYFTKQSFLAVKNGVGPSGHIFADLIKENFIPASSVLVRKDAIISVGGYDTRLRLEDWDLWLRLSKQYAFQCLPGIWGSYRILETSLIHSVKNKALMYESMNNTLEKHLGVSKDLDLIIRTHLYNYTVGMYRLGHISTYWSKQLLKNKFNFKSLVYFLLMRLGVNFKRILYRRVEM